jgi:hypothetical protein
MHGPVWRIVVHQPCGRGDAMRAKIMPDRRISLLTLYQVVASAQSLSRAWVGGRSGASVDDFLVDWACEAEAE